MSGPVRPRRKGSSGSHSSGNAIIPTDNGPALAAYYCAIFSLVPCFALLLGPAGVILGIKGLKRFKENPHVHGQAHAYIGMILGGLTFLVNLAVVVVMVIAATNAN